MENINNDWLLLVEYGRKAMTATDLCVETPNGKRLWRVNHSIQTQPKVQTLFCIAFCGFSSFFTGSEDGSLFWWRNEELTNVFPLHDGPLIDIAIHFQEHENIKGNSFYVATAGADKVIRLSRITDCNLFSLHNQILPHVPTAISNFFGSQKYCGLKFIGDATIHTRRKADPYNLPKMGILQSLRAKLNVDGMLTTVQQLFSEIFLVGTEENNILVIDLNAEQHVQEWMCGHRIGRVFCVSRGKETTEFVSVGEDSTINIWDTQQKSVVKHIQINDGQGCISNESVDCNAESEKYNERHAITCADTSLDGLGLIVGLQSKEIMLFDLQTYVNVEFIVEEFEVDALDVILDSSIFDHICISQRSLCNTIQKKIQRKFELLKARTRLEKLSCASTSQDTNFVEEEMTSLDDEINLLEKTIKQKIENYLKGLVLIPVELDVIAGYRSKIDSLLGLKTFRNLYKNEISEMRATKSKLEKIMLNSSEIRDVFHDLDSGVSHLSLQSPVIPMSRNLWTLQRKSKRVICKVGRIGIVKLSPDNMFLAVCGDVCTEIRFFPRINELACKINNSPGAVTHFDWSNDSRMFQINNSIGVLHFWSLHNRDGKWQCESTSPKAASSVEFSPWTCSMGWAVHGIVPKFTDRSSLIVSVNHGKDTVVVGNNEGSIFVHAYPCTNFQDKDLKIHCLAHAAPISSITFVGKNNTFISTSEGMSCCLLAVFLLAS